MNKLPYGTEAGNSGTGPESLMRRNSRILQHFRAKSCFRLVFCAHLTGHRKLNIRPAYVFKSTANTQEGYVIHTAYWKYNEKKTNKKKTQVVPRKAVLTINASDG